MLIEQLPLDDATLESRDIGVQQYGVDQLKAVAARHHQQRGRPLERDVHGREDPAETRAETLVQQHGAQLRLHRLFGHRPEPPLFGQQLVEVVARERLSPLGAARRGAHTEVGPLNPGLFLAGAPRHL